MVQEDALDVLLVAFHLAQAHVNGVVAGTVITNVQAHAVGIVRGVVAYVETTVVLAVGEDVIELVIINEGNDKRKHNTVERRHFQIHHVHCHQGLPIGV